MSFLSCHPQQIEAHKRFDMVWPCSTTRQSTYLCPCLLLDHRCLSGLGPGSAWWVALVKPSGRHEGDLWLPGYDGGLGVHGVFVGLPFRNTTTNQFLWNSFSMFPCGFLGNPWPSNFAALPSTARWQPVRASDKGFLKRVGSIAFLHICH